jgi:hypothetical protein
MSLKFLKELEIEKEVDTTGLKEWKINFSAPNCLKIVVPHLPTAEMISK